MIILFIYCCIVPNDNSTSSLFITNLNPVHMMVGTSIILTCSAKYPYSSFIDVATNVNIQWLNSSNHTLHSYTGLNDYTEHTLNYTISNVKLSDAGQYTCQYNVSSNNSFVIASDVMTNRTNVSIQSKSISCRPLFLITLTVPNTVIPAIVLIPYQSEYAVGNDITLSCSVIYSFPHNLDTNLTIQWLNSSSHILHSYTCLNDYTEHTLKYTISNVRLSDAGQYTCSFFINTSISHPYISSSKRTKNHTNIFIKSKNLFHVLYNY